MSRTAVCEVQCTRCGSMRVGAREVSCAVNDHGEALCSATCPACHQPILIRTSRRVAEMVLWFGGAADPRAPMELLEAHVGPPVSWDEVLDLHLALEGAQV